VIGEDHINNLDAVKCVLFFILHKYHIKWYFQAIYKFYISDYHNDGGLYLNRQDSEVIDMVNKKYRNLNRFSSEELEKDLKELLKLWSNSSSNLNMEEYAKIKSIALELKRRGVVTTEVEQVLNEI